MTDWPHLLTFAKNHPSAALALATLVRREGSSYRQPGARMLINAHGHYVGSLSGGCLEDDIAQAAQAVIAHGKPVSQIIDTRPHYGCPGKLEIFIERLPSAFFVQLTAALDARCPFVLRTRFRTTQGVLETSLHSRASTTCTQASTAANTGSDGEAYIDEVVCRAPRLVIVSGSHDAEPVRHFAELLGWKVHSIVPTQGATRSPLAPHEISCTAEELPLRYPPDDHTAVLIMTHNLVRDTHYLRHILPLAYSYIGLLGSRRRRETVLAELGEAGLLADETISERFYAPVGLDLGATDPAAIALSIVAEIQSVWSGRSGAALRSRLAPIHDTPRVALSPR